MLQAPVVSPSNLYALRLNRKSSERASHSDMADYEEDDDDEYGDDAGEESKGRNKSRRELPAGAVATLKAWLLSPEHFTHPYPTPQDQTMLMQKTGIDKKQLKNWFTNARRRIWKPMLKKQIEQGKLQTTAGISMPGLFQGMPGGGTMAATNSMENPHSVQAMRVHYQQAVQQQDQGQQSTDIYGNHTYSSAPTDELSGQDQYYVSRPDSSMQLANSTSIGTLPQFSSSNQLSKTDSHAVLMELFARDQDLVRQATESARLKAESKQMQGSSTQHPMNAPPPQGNLQAVPSINSWPHFSSISSLNNLGTMPGVKSITSLSGADLASKGSVGRMGNLAQVKSMESMGKNDSYAFLEVFFGERSSNNLSGMGGLGGYQKGMKQDSEDNEIGLSLEDESPAQPMRKDYIAPAPMSNVSQTFMTSQETTMDSGTLKRAYDDAMAARGLISVSRSCEKLTDLVLPAKMQRTLSQEFINKQQMQSQGHYYGDQYGFEDSEQRDSQDSQHYEPHQHQTSQPSYQSDANDADGHVRVSSKTICSICSQTNVDTQLRPCGHMFHERCLKPSLQTPSGPPRCPIDDIPMQSALLAVPTDDVPQQIPPSNNWNYPANQTMSADSSSS